MAATISSRQADASPITEPICLPGIATNWNMQFWSQCAPFGARENRRTKNIGRLNAEIGLNPAHQLVAIAHAIDVSLDHIVLV